MVLDHVRQRARFLVIRAAPLDADGFRRRNLHVVDVTPVPQGLENPVAEPECQDVLHSLLAQVVVDAVNLGFVEHLVDLAAQFARAGQIVSERLLHDEPPPAIALPQPRARPPPRRGGGPPEKEKSALPPRSPPLFLFPPVSGGAGGRAGRRRRPPP